MALSTMLQGEKDSALAKRMFLPLAERILEKALNEGYFRSHKDLNFYIAILKRTGNYSKALDLLTNEGVMGMSTLFSCSTSTRFWLLILFDLCTSVYGFPH